MDRIPSNLRQREGRCGVKGTIFGKILPCEKRYSKEIFVSILLQGQSADGFVDEAVATRF